jgi:U6 snRNA-associated Sm-like protein LSm8
MWMDARMQRSYPSFFLAFLSFPSAEVVMVLTSDGRIIVGKFVGHDQVQNLILNEAYERIYSQTDDVERVPLGLYVVRGDSLCLVAEFDEEAASDDVRIPFPLPSIQQQYLE